MIGTLTLGERIAECDICQKQIPDNMFPLMWARNNGWLIGLYSGSMHGTPVICSECKTITNGFFGKYVNQIVEESKDNE